MFFKTESDNFLNTLHENIEGLCLGMATVQGRDRSDVKALNVSLDNDIVVHGHDGILARSQGQAQHGIEERLRHNPRCRRCPGSPSLLCFLFEF